MAVGQRQFVQIALSHRQLFGPKCDSLADAGAQAARAAAHHEDSPVREMRSPIAAGIDVLITDTPALGHRAVDDP